MEGWKFWWGIAAFFLGGLATQLNGWITYRRQRADKEADAEAVLRQRREEFELQHLVEVNQLLRSLAERADAYANTWTSVLLRKDRQEEARQRLREALNATQDAENALSAQVGFIIADSVRSLVRTAAASIQIRVRSISDVDPLVTFEEAVKRGSINVGPYTGLEEMVRALDMAYEAISARVRALYAGGA